MFGGGGGGGSGGNWPDVTGEPVSRSRSAHHASVEVDRMSIDPNGLSAAIDVPLAREHYKTEANLVHRNSF